MNLINNKRIEFYLKNALICFRIKNLEIYMSVYKVISLII